MVQERLQMKLPLVSTVIPTHNRPELVQRAIHSALRQTIADIEVIVVIDGPDETTRRTLSGIADPRVRVFALHEQVGGSEARNTGVRAARAPWVAFLDDDDEWFPHKLERQLDAAKTLESRYPVIYSRYIGRSQDGDTVMAARLPAKGEPISEYLFCRKGLRFGETGLGSSELLAPTSLMREVPFEVGLRKHQDWDWVLRAAQHPGVKLHVVPEMLAIYHMQDNVQRLSNNDEWRFSLEWAQERIDLITPKAYSFFLATECVTRAKKVRAGTRVYLLLSREFLFRGSPRFRSTLLFLGFALIPIKLRTYLRKLVGPRGKTLQQGSKNESSIRNTIPCH
jgi:glycosyltransferase involved in cell wall biosynthesis